MSRPAIPQLTGLRFFAAFAVLLSHFTATGFLATPAWVVVCLDGGRPAVSLFFVLSGFVLSYTYNSELQKPGALQRYYLARFARIYPVHILALTISLLAFIVAGQIGVVHELLEWFAIKPDQSIPMLTASFAAQLTVLTAWLPFAGINQPWNGAAWSISCEFFFYALFPFLLAKLRRRSGTWLLIFTLVCWGAQGSMILGVRELLPPNRSGFIISQFPITHLFEFVLGISGAQWFLNGGSQRLEPHAGCLLLTACTGIFALSVLQPLSPAYFLQSPLFAMLILALAAGRAGRLLGFAPVVLLGEASFALYLIHIPILHFARVLGVSQSHGISLLLAVILLSIVIFKTYEEPVRKMIRRAGSGVGRAQLTRARYPFS